MRAAVVVLGPLLGAPRPGARLAAGRLRDRRRGRSTAPEGAGSAGRRASSSTTATSRRGRPAPARARDIALRPRHRHRHREPHDGRGPRRGDHLLENAAREPEVADLARAPQRDGRAGSTGAGTPHHHHRGVEELHRGEHAIIPDRIEAGTFLVGGGHHRRRRRGHAGAAPSTWTRVVAKLEEAGAQVDRRADGLRVVGRAAARRSTSTRAAYPGFPTDMQAQFMALMTHGRGQSRASPRPSSRTASCT